LNHSYLGGRSAPFISPCNYLSSKFIDLPKQVLNFEELLLYAQNAYILPVDKNALIDFFHSKIPHIINRRINQKSKDFDFILLISISYTLHCSDQLVVSSPPSDYLKQIMSLIYRIRSSIRSHQQQSDDSFELLILQKCQILLDSISQFDCDFDTGLSEITKFFSVADSHLFEDLPKSRACAEISLNYICTLFNFAISNQELLSEFLNLLTESICLINKNFNVNIPHSSHIFLTSLQQIFSILFSLHSLADPTSLTELFSV
jgi:hypothetical protein